MIAIGGENLIDLIHDTDTECPTYAAHPGGSPFNVAIAAGRQGGACCYLTPVSTDTFGQMLVDRLVDAGVHVVGPRVFAPTSLAVVSVMAGLPSYGFYRQGTADRQVSVSDIRQNLTSDVTIFHVGSLALIDGPDADIWETCFLDARSKGLLTSLDPNIRSSLVTDPESYRARLKRLMAQTDILKLSDEDVMWLYPDRSFEAACSACLADSGACITVFTRGASGVIAYTDQFQCTRPAHPVRQFMDSVGAGDTFMASFLVWCLGQSLRSRADLQTVSKDRLKDALEYAAAAAALNCEKTGCQPPTVQDIRAAQGV